MATLAFQHHASARSQEVDDPHSALTVRVGVIIPCFNRPGDAQMLLADLAGIQTRTQPLAVDLRVLLVDNASATPLTSLSTPRGLALEHLRLHRNTGGSGGFNAGLSHVLALGPSDGPGSWAEFDPRFVWLVDSDARVGPRTLLELLAPMLRDPSIVAAGSAIADPLSGQVFEIGGMVDRDCGRFDPAVRGIAGLPPSSEAVIDCDYVAACSALVRADAVRATGLMPARFLNADDVEWFIRMAQVTGGRVVGVPASLAMHPRFDRFPTWTRYYSARNAFGPIDALGLGRRVRLVRALREAARAAQQSLFGRADLASLHLKALHDAARGRTTGPALEGALRLNAPTPLNDLAETLPPALPRGLRGARVLVHPDLRLAPPARARLLDDLRAAGAEVVCSIGSSPSLTRRVLRPSRFAAAVVPARGRLSTWLLAPISVQVDAAGETFVVRPSRRLLGPAGAAWTALKGAVLSARVALGPRERPSELNVEFAASRAAGAIAPDVPLLDIIVLSYNRWSALERTLAALLADDLCRPGPGPSPPARIRVVDNASSDDTPSLLAQHFPGVDLLRLERNAGVEAFNLGVDRAGPGGPPFLLILDDDARPAPGTLGIAMDRLRRDPTLGAYTLHPRHPASGASEWSFAHAAFPRPSRAWPVMGCANLVRKDAWNAVAGYEPAYFLYRNDMDLALKLLDAGWGVGFDPALVVWHDTPAGAGAAKSLRWHRLATRNWVWTARRHARGPAAALGAALGWVWAHRLAGLSVTRHWATLGGLIDGVAHAPPACATPRPGLAGAAWRRFLSLRLFGRRPDPR